MAVVQVVMNWITLYYSSDEVRARVHGIWESLCSRILVEGRVLWRYVREPTATLIATLAQLGFEPSSPTRWSNGEVVWELTGEAVDLKMLLHDIRHVVAKKLWSGAAQHLHGKGLESGAYMGVLHKHLARLTRKHKSEDHGLLVRIATAGMWPQDRRAAAGMAVDSLCPLCKVKHDSLFHRTYECTVIAADESMAPTADLVPGASEGMEALPCLWLRGITPASWLDEVPDAPDAAEVVCLGAMADVDWQLQASPTFCSDGSGGAFTSTPILRRCGWGLVEVRGDPPYELSGVGRTLAGRNQTVNRAELAPLIELVRRVPSHFVLYSDSKYVVNGYQRQRFLAPIGSNADLWYELGAALRHRDPSSYPIVIKVKAHLTEDEALAAGIPPAVYFGNFLADVIADKFAEIAQLPLSITGNYELHSRLAWRIQDRLLAANRVFLAQAPPVPQVARIPRPRPTPGARLAARFARSAHQAVAGKHGSVSCTRCGGKSTSLTVHAWLRSPCVPLVPQHFAPGGGLARVPGGAGLFVGTVAIHPSHVVLSKQGIVWCSTCGSYTTSAQASKSGTKGLGKPCSRAPSAGGLYVLGRLARGLPPRPGQAWPEP